MAKETTNPYRTCFESSKPKEAQIARAVAILLEAQGKPENPTLMRSWAQHLTTFSGDQLAAAFNSAALTSKGWPTLGDITEPIFEAELAEDLTWLLRGLKVHGAEWSDRPAIYGDRFRLPRAGMNDWQPGPLIEAEVRAPEIPKRLLFALHFLGAGTPMDGLSVLARHPNTGLVTLDVVESGRTRFQIERDFKAAWMIARRQELT